MPTEVIEIVTTLVDGVSKPVRKVTQSIENLNGAQHKITTTTQNFNKKTGELTSTMQRQQAAGKRFQMQWLSLLFFGMAMQRMFGGLIKTSLEWVGITELMSTTLGVLFLPVAAQLLEFLLPIMDWFMNLPEPMKKALGWFVVGGFILGTFLSTLGQVALGLAGIKWLTASSGLMGLGNAASGAAGKVGGLTAALKGLAAIVAVAIAVTLLFSGMKEADASKALTKIFIGGLAAGIAALLFGATAVAAIAIGALAVVIALEVRFHWFEKAKEGINDMVRSIKERVNRVFAGTGTIGEIFKGAGPADVVYDMHFGVAATKAEVDKMYHRESAGYDPFTGKKVEDAIISPRGDIISTSPEDYLIATKDPGSLGGGGSLNVTYNVVVSDKREFETMLRANNENLRREVMKIS